MQHAQPGQPMRIPAATWNSMLSMLAWWKRTQNGTGGGTSKLPPQAGVFKVRNGSGSAVERFGVLGIGGPLFDPEDSETAFKNNELIFEGALPVEKDHWGKFCVVLEPLAANKIGRAVFAGLVHVQLDVTHDLPYEFADIIAGDTAKLYAGWSGRASIEWRAPGTGTKWAVVNLGPQAQKSKRWAKFNDEGTWELHNTLEVILCDEEKEPLDPEVLVQARNSLVAEAEYDEDKLAVLMGRKRELELIAVDPCAPE